ncbi:MAG TPA: hypothetical protein VK400_19605 [Pyrinomonadaceae bacterium]|nr:hypothetical protein [Pyrinomonadaceae bacterium]
MINTKFILFVSLLSAFLCGACSSNPAVEAQNSKSCEASPSERVSQYQSKLVQSDFVGINRYYSKRVLQTKLNNREPEGCKKAEDCLTAASRIAGFEVSVADGESKILKEISTPGTNRTKVETVPLVPSGVKIIYELVQEDGDWYIDKAFWENGELIRGFEDAPLKEVKTGGGEVSPK